MPQITPNSVSILPSAQSSGGVSLRNAAAAFKYNAGQSQDAALWASNADALSSAQSQIDQIVTALRGPLPTPQVIQLTDPYGNMVAQIGDPIGSNNQSYPGIWAKNLYVGGQGPDTAPFFCNGSDVVIGQNGQVFVIDHFGNPAAWLGTQTESSLAISGAANNGSGLIRIALTAHGYVSGDEVSIASVGGVPNASGQWVISVIDANHFDLLGSTFAGSYTSGGTSQRYFAGGLFGTVAVGAAQRITNVQNNGSGAVRITIPSHGYATGYQVVLAGIVGVPNITGISWPITVVDANDFDLVGSTFSGSYVSGGISLNWPTAKFIARADGSLDITNATIMVSTGNGTVTIGPVSPVDGSANATIAVVGNQGSSPFPYIELQAGFLYAGLTGSLPTVTIDGNNGLFISPPGTGQPQIALNTAGEYSSIVYPSSSDEGISVWAYSTLAGGPMLQFARSRGGAFPSEVYPQSGDSLGAIYGGALHSALPHASGAIAFVATQNQSSSAFGTQILFDTTPNGVLSPSTRMVLDQSGYLGIGINPPGYPLDVSGIVNSTGFSVFGTPGISKTLTYGASVTVNAASLNYGASLTVNTASNGVFGIPGIGQTNGTVVTGVTLNLNSASYVTGVTLNTSTDTFTEGIITA